MQKKLLVMSGCSIVITDFSNTSVNDFYLQPTELRELNEVQCIMGNGNMGQTDMFKPVNLRPHCTASPPPHPRENVAKPGPYCTGTTSGPRPPTPTPTHPPLLACGPFASCWNAFLGCKEICSL